MKWIWDTIVRIGIIGASFFTEYNEIAENEVPSVVRNNFEKKFSDAMEAEWAKNNDYYEVDFLWEETEYSAIFDGRGSMLMHKKEIAAEDLPAAVKESIQQYVSKSRIEETEKVDKEGVEYYQVEFEGKGPKQVFTANGKAADKVQYWD